MEQALGTSASTLSNQGTPYESLAAVLHHSRALTWRGPRPRFRIHSGARVPSSSSSSSSSSKQPSPSIPQVAKQFKGLAERASTSVAPPYHYQANEILQVNKGTMLVISAAILGMAVLAALVKPKDRTGGSVEDLVKRGQLRSDRRSDSRPLKYEDPFNNPMVKVGERNTVVKMYGKAFRLQPVTLTEEKMLSHQNRRVQAYQWKRPTVFLVEGEPIPDGIDPDTVRWIPPNHPFATAKNDFDEVAAEKNVYQTRGVPSRVRAEHEALRKRMMEAAEKETELQFPVFDPMTNSERKRIEKPFQVLSDQPDNGLGSRPIKPFEKPDGDISAKVQENPSSPFNPNVDYGQP